MEKVEPIFVPEWLRSNGSAKARQTAPSLANSDGRISSNSNNVSLKRVNGSNIGRSSVSDKTTSAYFRRSSSSNGYSHSRSNGSFGRNNRDTEWDKDKDTFNSCHKDNGYSHSRREYSYPSENRFDKDLRRSHSTLNGKLGDTWSQKESAVTVNSYKSTNKSAFQRDFPSLGGEVRKGAAEIGRIKSPGLTNLINSLPSDKWSSALAEAPVLVKNDGLLSTPLQASSNNGGPSVADTLTQSPPRSNSSSPKLPTENQKVEEQAVKQSRQLVPLTSSMPKAIVHNASEKLKPKVGQKMQISSSLQSNHLNRGSNVKPDVSRASGTGKHFVLKSEREGNSVEHKPTPVLERKPSAQAKSRNEFFNLMRKKSLETPQSALSPSNLDNDDDVLLPESFVEDGLADKENEIQIKGKSVYVIEKSVNECQKECSWFKAFSYSEEREGAFLHSLGWEKTEEEDESGLTKDEISAFYKDLNEQIKSRPSSRSLQKLQLKYSNLLNNHTWTVINGCVSSDQAHPSPSWNFNFV